MELSFITRTPEQGSFPVPLCLCFLIIFSHINIKISPWNNLKEKLCLSFDLQVEDTNSLKKSAFCPQNDCFQTVSRLQIICKSHVYSFFRNLLYLSPWKMPCEKNITLTSTIFAAKKIWSIVRFVFKLRKEHPPSAILLF